MKNLLFFFLITSIAPQAFSQTHFWTQKQIDTFNDYLGTDVYIFTMESLNDPIVNIKPLMTKNWQGVSNMNIFNTSVIEIDFTGVKHDYLEYLHIFKNKELKTIKGLNKLVNYRTIAIDSNDKLEQINFQFDTLNSGSIIYVRGNPKLMSIDLKYMTDFYYYYLDPFYMNFYNDGHGMYIANNKSLKRISYNKQKGDGRLSRFFVLNNTSLDSIIFNKINTGPAKSSNVDTFSSTKYFQFSSFNGFHTGNNYEKGFRLNITGNDSLRYIGTNFGNDTFSLVSLVIKNNTNLNDLCIFKKKILEFPNPQSNLSLLYDISNNAPGANSISEVVSGECKKTTPIRDITVVQNSIAVWPNPASSYLSVTLPDENVYDVTFINSVGQEVWRGKVSNEQNMLSVANFSKGLYLLRFKEKTGTQTVKCMIE